MKHQRISRSDPATRAQFEGFLNRLIESCALIDIRGRADYDKLWIRGSLNLPHAELVEAARTIQRELQADGESPTRDRYRSELETFAAGRALALVGASEDSSGEARELLHSLGMVDPAVQTLHIVEGGIERWDVTGMPLEGSSS